MRLRQFAARKGGREIRDDVEAEDEDNYNDDDDTNEDEAGSRLATRNKHSQEWRDAISRRVLQAEAAVLAASGNSSDDDSGDSRLVDALTNLLHWVENCDG